MDRNSFLKAWWPSFRIVFAALSVTVCMTACRQDDPDAAAAPLLNEAREALNVRQFDKAHALLDSIRTVYPRAVATRWAALDFEDTLKLEEARVEAARADIVYVQAKDSFDTFCAQHPDISPLDSQFQRMRNRVDTLGMENDRLQMKVKFYLRKLQEKRQTAK